MRESVIEKYLVAELRKLRAVVKKVGGPGWRGWPDRMVLFPGGVVHWVEVKRPRGGRFEPLQLRNHATLRKLGFVVRVVNTKPSVSEYIAAVHTDCKTR